MYLYGLTTLDLYNDTNSKFNILIKFFPVVNDEILSRHGLLEELNYSYNLEMNNYPFKRDTILTELILKGLYETRKILHTNYRVIELYSPQSGNKGILYNLVKNWGPNGQNIFNSKCLDALYNVMSYIEKKINYEIEIYKIIEQSNLPRDEMESLISNISKIDIKSKNVDDISSFLNQLNLKSNSVSDITSLMQKL